MPLADTQPFRSGIQLNIHLQTWGKRYCDIRQGGRQRKGYITVIGPASLRGGERNAARITL